MSRLQQNSAQLTTSARGPPKPNLVQIHPLGASGIWVKYNVFVAFYLFIYLFIYMVFFLRLVYRSDRLMDFYARLLIRRGNTQ